MTSTHSLPATVWRDRALMARVAEQSARSQAERLWNDRTDPRDPWAAERARRLAASHECAAAAHADYARQCEQAFADAADAEMSQPA